MVLESVNLQEYTKMLEEIGFYDVALPFLLIFAITFAILQKARIFGKESRKVNIIIALVTAFLVIRVQPIVKIINMFLPKVSLYVVVVIALLMVLGIFGLHAEWRGFMLLIAVIVSVIAIIWALTTTAIPGFPSALKLSTKDIAVLCFVGAVVLCMYLITREPKGRGGGTSYLGKLPGELGRGSGG